MPRFGATHIKKKMTRCRCENDDSDKMVTVVENGDMILTNENSKIKTEFDTFSNVSWKVSGSIDIATRCPPNANKEIRFAPFKLFQKL